MSVIKRRTWYEKQKGIGDCDGSHDCCIRSCRLRLYRSNSSYGYRCDDGKKDDATAEAAQTTDGEPVTITFMHDWPEYEAEFTQMISDFEAANPDIKVETQVITWDVLTQTLTTAFAAGEAPDVACCWANQMGSFNSVGATYDLTPYLEENNNEWRDSLLAPAVQSGTVNDQVFCIPFRTTCTVLAYNKTMMEENGWEVPTTLEEFETLLGEAAKTGVTPLLTPGNPHGFQIASLVETFALHYMYDAGYLKNNDYLTGHYTDVAKEYAEAGARLRDWVDKGYLDADSLAMTREDATGQFYLQKGLFAFVNNNELTDLEKNSAEAGFEIGVMAFPAPEGTPTLLHNFGVDGFMVYSGTKYPEQSARFLKYITSKDVQQKFGNETLSVMANKDCTYDNANQSEFAEIFSSAESYRKTMITVPAISDQILVIWKQNFSPILPKLRKNSVRRSKMRTSNYLKKTVSNK